MLLLSGQYYGGIWGDGIVIRRLKEYHCDAMLYRGENVNMDQEVFSVSCEYWVEPIDWEGHGFHECWRVTLWGKIYDPFTKKEILELIASVVFPRETMLVLGEMAFL